MKQALQALEIAPNPQVRLDIMLDKKKITIREGHRDYHIGPLVLFSHIFPWAVKTTITYVRLTTVAQVTEDEFWEDGYQSRKEMLTDLRKFYPNLTMKSPVTVIRWGELDEGYYTNIDHLYEFAEQNGLDMSYE